MDCRAQQNWQMEGGASTILYRSPPASTKSSRVELWANNRRWVLGGCCYNYIIYWNMAEGDGFEPLVPVASEPVYIAEGELRGDRLQASP